MEFLSFAKSQFRMQRFRSVRIFVCVSLFWPIALRPIIRNRQAAPQTMCKCASPTTNPFPHFANKLCEYVDAV